MNYPDTVKPSDFDDKYLPKFVPIKRGQCIDCGDETDVDENEQCKNCYERNEGVL